MMMGVVYCAVPVVTDDDSCVVTLHGPDERGITQAVGRLGMQIGRSGLPRNRRRFCSFFGLAYAKAPVGELRFEVGLSNCMQFSCGYQAIFDMRSSYVRRD